MTEVPIQRRPLGERALYPGDPDYPKAPARTYAQAVDAMADALHEDCRLEWQAVEALGRGHEIVRHWPSKHWGQAHDLVRRYNPELDPSQVPF